MYAILYITERDLITNAQCYVVIWWKEVGITTPLKKLRIHTLI